MKYIDHLPTLVNYIIVTFYKIEYFNQYWWMDYGYTDLEIFLKDLYNLEENIDLNDHIIKNSSPILKKFEEYRQSKGDK